MTKILVIQNKRIGDVLISSVIANNMKQVFPDSEITYFVYDYTVGVLENNPNIDKIIAVNDKELKKFSNLFKAIKQVRDEKFDIIFDSYAKFQSRLLCLFSGAEIRTGFKRSYKTLKFPFYTHPINFLDDKSLFCGKAIDDRINMMQNLFTLKEPLFHPKIYLTDTEKKYSKTKNLKKPIVMFGVMGSTKSKSMPFDYVAKLIDFVAGNYDVSILFNYAPYQKEEALEIYNMCQQKESINFEIYEESIRGFCCLMNACDLIISNEGGSVHIAKALDKPTFTIYSPFIEKGDWNSFEDEITHQSIHLLEEKPSAYQQFTRDSRKVIEENPEEMYRKLTPEMIIAKLKPYLEHQLQNAKR